MTVSIDDDESTTADDGTEPASSDAAEPSALTEPSEPAAARPRPSRAERLEARAARLREADEQAEARRAARAGAPTASRRLVVLGSAVLAVLVLLLVAASVGLLLARSGESSAKARLATARALDAQRTTVLGDAQRFATDISSYDYQQVQSDFARADSHLTPSFAKSYTSVTSGLQSTIVQYKAVSKATIQAAGLTSLTPTTAVVVLFVDQSITNTQSSTPTIERNRMQMTLQRQPNGTWLVSNLILK